MNAGQTDLTFTHDASMDDKNARCIQHDHRIVGANIIVAVDH